MTREAAATKAYLGDGAYASFDGHAITLTAENGIRATDKVVLEPEVFAALLRFAAAHGLRTEYNAAAVDALLAHVDADCFDNAWEDRLEALAAAVRLSMRVRPMG